MGDENGSQKKEEGRKEKEEISSRERIGPRKVKVFGNEVWAFPIFLTLVISPGSFKWYNQSCKRKISYDFKSESIL